MEKTVSRMGSGKRRVRLPKPPSADRRGHVRYPLCMDLRYTVVHPYRAGSGRVVDLSSSGLRFIADRPLEAGLEVELAVSWPLLLDGGVPLQLLTSGKVVWANGAIAALQIGRHEFRTRGGGQESE